MNSAKSILDVGSEFVGERRWLKFALIGLASPFIGVVVFAVLTVAIGVVGWIMYGTVVWIGAFMLVLSNLMGFPFMTGSPPTVALVISVLGGVGYHMFTMWILFETLDQL